MNAVARDGRSFVGREEVMLSQMEYRPAFESGNKLIGTGTQGTTITLSENLQYFSDAGERTGKVIIYAKI